MGRIGAALGPYNACWLHENRTSRLLAVTRKKAGAVTPKFSSRLSRHMPRSSIQFPAFCYVGDRRIIVIPWRPHPTCPLRIEHNRSTACQLAQHPRTSLKAAPPNGTAGTEPATFIVVPQALGFDPQCEASHAGCADPPQSGPKNSLNTSSCCASQGG